MADKHTFRINQDKHRDVLIQKLYEQNAASTCHL